MAALRAGLAVARNVSMDGEGGERGQRGQEEGVENFSLRCSPGGVGKG